MGRVLLMRMCFATVAAVLVCQSAVAQKKANQRLAFDVASVKPVAADAKEEYQYRFEPGGRLLIRDFRVIDLIIIAWHLRAFEIEGPEWISQQGAYYDIDAEASGNPTVDQMRVMLQSLLEDRFHLVAHLQSKIGPYFALRRDGSPGKGLAPTKPGACAHLVDYGARAPLMRTGWCGPVPERNLRL